MFKGVVLVLVCADDLVDFANERGYVPNSKVYIPLFHIYALTIPLIGLFWELLRS